MKKWTDPDKKLPKNGQYCWVAYYPWNNKSNPVAIQPATWRDGLWVLDGEGGTSCPPVAWMPNSNEQPPEYKK